MNRYLLDTSALLTLRDDEPGADRVADVLGLALQGKAKCFGCFIFAQVWGHWIVLNLQGKAKCFGCFISLMEVLYRVWRDENPAAGQLAYRQCLALPMEWLSSSEPLLLKAAEYKASFPLSIADAWIAACASEQEAILLHKDPEFAPVPVTQEWLPLKATKP